MKSTNENSRAGRRSARHHSHEQCFACGVTDSGGLRLHFDIDDPGIAAAEWVPLAKFKSYPDRVHGGVVATLLDSAMVHALFGKGITGVTAEISIRYLEAVTLDGPVSITGWVEHSSRRLHRCRAELIQHGRLAVRATAKFIPLPSKRP